MKNRVLLWVGIATILLIGSAIGGAIVAARRAEATRNSAGTVSLATSPVVSNQVIGSALWNNTFGGLRQDVEDSLDRNGRGGMLAAIRGIDGTVGSPAYSWTSDTGLGEYRIGSGDLGWAVGGVKKLELTSSLFTVVPAASFSSTVVINNDLTVDNGGANAGTVANSLRFGLNSGGEAIASKRTAGGNQFGLDFYTGSVTQLQIANGGTITTIGPLKIGASGTAVSAVYRVSASHTSGSIAANSCQTSGSTITVTGAATGDQCMLSTLGPTSLAPFCYITSSNTVQPYFCNPGTGSATPASGTYTITVIH